MIPVVSVLCLALLSSALFTFKTLSRLRDQYLSNRGHEIAAALEAQMRGPGRRNNPAVWQSVFEENYEAYSRTVAFFSLVDKNGNSLAGKGNSLVDSSESGAVNEEDIYYFEEPLGQSRNPRGVAHPTVGDWRIQIGLYTADADFIRRTAYMQLGLSGLAILVLLGLLIYLLHTLHRFMEMKAREGAEAQLKSLGIMAASLAHEIRNPLGAIKGLTQLAQEELPSGNPAQSHLQTVVSEAERLESLVANLLDFARPKEPQISEFDVRNVLADVRSMLQSRMEASGVELGIEAASDQLLVKSDPSGLRQVLLNVLLNAIDASPRGSRVVLKSFHDESKRLAILRIDDAGPGLGGKNPDEFFQPFVTTKARGTGLGLAISRKIMERLGGSIILEDSPQGGARCSIRLPVD
jgi:signal transduction histidine kinase